MSDDRPRVLATVALVSAGVVACANMGSPPGGPEDRDPLAIVGATPAPDAAGLSPDTPVVIVFGERPDRRSVMRALAVMPPADFRETAWTDTSLTLVPEIGWALDRNTIVRVDRSARDRRGNELEQSFRLRFTTKAVPDSGVVKGRVWAGREVSSSHTVAVAAYPAHPDTGADPETGWPAALDDAPQDGNYRLTGLDTARSWLVVGIANRDGDVRPTASGEVWGRAPSLVTFGEESELEVPEFLIGTLDSLGTLAGDVAADSGALAVVVVERSDFRESEHLPDGGSFELTVPTGFAYRLGAFLDLDADSLRGEDEPHVELEEPVGLKLVARRDGISFDLTGLGETPDSAAVPDVEAPPSEEEGAE